MSDLQQLVTLSDAQYSRQQQGIQRILSEEARLRNSLRQLDQQLADSRQSDDTAQRALGADLLWQGWVGRKKTELNQQLARLMVIKEKHMVQLRRAHGKFLVSQQLRDEAALLQRKKRREAALDRAIDSSLFAPGNDAQ